MSSTRDMTPLAKAAASWLVGAVVPHTVAPGVLARLAASWRAIRLMGS